MKLQTVLKQIKKHIWWSEEAPGVLAFTDRMFFGFIEQAKYFHPKYLSISIIIYKNGFFYEESPADEKLEIYYYIYNKIKKNKNYLKKYRKDSLQSVRKFNSFTEKIEKDISLLSNKKLWKLYEGFIKEYINYLCYGAMLESVDVFAEELPILIKKENPNLSDKQVMDIAMTMAAPTILGFLEKEEKLLFEGVLAKSPELKKILNKLVKKYYWIENNYKRAKFLDEKYFLKRINELKRKYPKKEITHEFNNFKTKISRLKMAKKQFLRKYKFSRALKRHFMILEYIAEWIDERKSYMTKTNAYHEIFCQEIARRFKINQELVKYYTYEEFKGLLLHNKRAPVGLIKRRRSLSVHVIVVGKGRRAKGEFFYDKEAKSIYNAFFKIDKNREIKGQVACAPVSKMRGRAQIILDPDKQKFKSGNILVTTMTRPDFVPLLRHTKAIITDEGGLTCHAAIVSRELGVPCIIGTKIATKVLKDGDLVEVDANKGVVRKLK